jgi:glycosyltransferase involved in cell wall biosynthesis
MERDPLAEVRARIAAALSAKTGGQLRIVHVVHGWPPYQQAGTELYASWLVARQREAHHVAVYIRGADPARADGEAVEQLDGGVRLRIVTNHFRSRDPFRRNALAHRALERDFERFLRGERPDLVHVHHLAGHTFSLAAVARRLRIPVVMQVQDWWALCARVNLLDRDGNRCSGPAAAKCAACATLTRLPPAKVTNRAMHAFRRAAVRRALRAADAFIAGSNAIRADYAAIVPPATPFHVLPYGVAIAPVREPRPPVRPPVRFGYVGSIALHKGVHVAVEAMRGIDATLHVWGDASALPAYAGSMRAAAPPNVLFEGSFAEAEKERVFASMDVLLVPSVGLESFGLAAREAMARGVPVVASAGGALSEMFESGVCGELFPAGDAAALHAILRRMAADPSIIDRLAERLPRPKSDAVHAAEVEAVYRTVLVK